MERGGGGGRVKGRQEFKDARALNESLVIDWEKPLLLCGLKCPKFLAVHQASFQ